MDLLQRLREAQADTKRDMKRTDLRTKDVLLLSDVADVFGECADEIERLREQLSTYKDLHQAVTDANVTLSQEKAALNDWVQGQAIDIRDYKDEIDKLHEQLSNMMHLVASVEREREAIHEENNKFAEDSARLLKERDELLRDLNEVFEKSKPPYMTDDGYRLSYAAMEKRFELVWAERKNAFAAVAILKEQLAAMTKEREEWQQEALDHCEKVVRQANATLGDRHYMRLADEQLAACQALCRQYREALEKSRTAILTMRDNAEDYGKRYARAFVDAYRDLLPGSAKEQFDSLARLQDQMNIVMESVVEIYDLLATPSPQVAPPTTQCPVPIEEVKKAIEEFREAATWEYVSEFDFITEADLMTKAADIIERLAGIRES